MKSLRVLVVMALLGLGTLMFSTTPVEAHGHSFPCYGSPEEVIFGGGAGARGFGAVTCQTEDFAAGATISVVRQRRFRADPTAGHRNYSIAPLDTRSMISWRAFAGEDRGNYRTRIDVVNIDVRPCCNNMRWPAIRYESGWYNGTP